MDESRDDFNTQQAELFEVLGHPTRIAILRAVKERPLGFAELKRSVGIESSGNLTFHLSKLGRLVRTDEQGNYAISDQGRDALRIIEAAEKVNPPSVTRSGTGGRAKRTSLVLLAFMLAIGVVLILTGAYLSAQGYAEGPQILDIPGNVTIAPHGSLLVWLSGDNNPWPQTWHFISHWSASGNLVLNVRRMGAATADVLTTTPPGSFVDTYFSIPVAGEYTLNTTLINNSDSTVHLNNAFIWVDIFDSQYQALGNSLIYIGGAIAIVDGVLLALLRLKNR